MDTESFASMPDGSAAPDFQDLKEAMIVQAYLEKRQSEAILRLSGSSNDMTSRCASSSRS